MTRPGGRRGFWGLAVAGAIGLRCSPLHAARPARRSRRSAQAAGRIRARIRRRSRPACAATACRTSPMPTPTAAFMRPGSTRTRGRSRGRTAHAGHSSLEGSSANRRVRSSQRQLLAFAKCMRFARRPHVPRPDDHGRRTTHRVRNSANRAELAHLHRRCERLPREAVRKRRRQFLLEALGPRKVTGSTSRLTTSCRRRSGSSRGHAGPQQRRRPQ
jgi:hypothetical protein